MKLLAVYCGNLIQISGYSDSHTFLLLLSLIFTIDGFKACGCFFFFLGSCGVWKRHQIMATYASDSVCVLKF